MENAARAYIHLNEVFILFYLFIYSQRENKPGLSHFDSCVIDFFFFVFD